jgi:hypothetical protein
MVYSPERGCGFTEYTSFTTHGMDKDSGVGDVRMRYVIAILIVLAVVVAAIYVRRSDRLEQRAANERKAEEVIRQLVSANDEFREKDVDGNGIKDFWTGDVAGLVQAMNLPHGIATADPRALASKPGSPIPYHGYLFVAMDTDDSGSSPESLLQITDGKSGNVHHRSKLAFCAYPADYRVSGIATIIINQDHARFRRVTRGQPVLRWPADHTLQHEYGK